MVITFIQPFGLALLDYFNGDKSTNFTIHRDDGYIDEIPISAFFKNKLNLSDLEKSALKLCNGDILDFGAGAGSHSLILQRKGYNVHAIDVLPQACEIMRQRGVKKVSCIDFFVLTNQLFNTILLLGGSLVGDLDGLGRFLRHAFTLLKSNGKIIFNSEDVRKTTNKYHLAYQEINKKANRYIGEVVVWFEYKGIIGPQFKLIHVDPKTLANYASIANFRCKIIHENKDGSYLAQVDLTK